MLNIALFGAPGAGKGTQSKKIIEKYNLVYLSTGEILRREIEQDTEIGNKAKSIIARGELVPDELIVQVIEEHIKTNPEANGFLFDGFPRTMVQAYILEGLLMKLNTELTCMISLEVPREKLKERLLGRAKSSHRLDDTQAVIEYRLKEYYEKTTPVAKFYEEKSIYYGIDGVGELDEVFERINHSIETALKETLLNVVLIGRPGCGKGSQGHLLAKKFNLAYISTGHLLRQEIRDNTELGKQVAPYLETGLNVPDEIIIQMLEHEIKLHPTAKGFIFKGFPRTIVQAYILDGMLLRMKNSVSIAINLDVPMLECFKRLSARSKTDKGRAYDSNTDLIIRRMEEYETQTKPVTEYYKKQRKFTAVSSLGDKLEINDHLTAVIEKWFKKIR
jgi:adenylate kinase